MRWPVAVSADPWASRPQALQPVLLRASEGEYGDCNRQQLFDQYKLAVEMADRVSARRMQANTFFLAVNTGLIAVLVLCYGWWRIVGSYRQLSSGKHAVILEIETLLPAAPYAAEWAVLGEGRDPRRYLPLTRVETWVPRLFALLYLLLLLAVLLGGQGPAAGGGSP
jgi:hypothetical protein